MKKIRLLVFYIQNGVPRGTRILDPLIKSQMLYRLSYRNMLVASDGFEPSECQSQSLMPYHLATRQYRMVGEHGFEPWNPKEQIYSLPRLTTSLTLHKKSGVDRGNRTPNLLITSQLRYLLRYVGKWWAM